MKQMNPCPEHLSIQVQQFWLQSSVLHIHREFAKFYFYRNNLLFNKDYLWHDPLKILFCLSSQVF